MAYLREIKRRKESIQGTEQITKAMKLISTVKLQKAAKAAQEYRPYMDMVQVTVDSIAAGTDVIDRHRFGASPDSLKGAVLLITSNRGLAGGYSSQMAKMLDADSRFNPDDTLIYAAGRKGLDYMARRGYRVAGDFSEIIEKPVYEDAARVADTAISSFLSGKFAELYVAFTSFKNTVIQVPQITRLLPVTRREGGKTAPNILMNYEPDEEEVLDYIVPRYISSVIYGALLEAYASEQAARMTAMDTASNNADDMIEALSVQYNRARQGAITQELTEIIAGAETW